MRKLLLILFILAGAACAPRETHLISSPALRQAMSAQFSLQQELAQQRREALFAVFDQPLSLTEREALEWLYAWMPLSDLADYDGSFYLRQVRATLAARAAMSWGTAIPEELLLHFVLPLRVNNENLDSARVVFYGMLRERVNGLGMRQAALEVNRWCHERVTYRGADIRTSAPLATMRSAIGRCGEESVFTVAALRAVGIPARQVYVPRWAHSDDNHAWVEVWADGEWFFLGACEPDPDLNMGWFKEPVRRAMLVHTRVLGPWQGEEELLAASPRHREINVLDRYAVTKTLHVRVLQPDGQPASGVAVTFRLYNYAEFYPLAERVSDTQGMCQLQTGLGDLLVRARRDSLVAEMPARVAAQDTVTLTLQPFVSREEINELDFMPPLARPALPDTITAAQREHHARRLSREDSLRRAWEDTFCDSLASARLAAELALAPDSVWSFMHKSRGNHAEIGRYLRQGLRISRRHLLPLLAIISDKDLRDTPADVLLDHLKGAAALETSRAVPPEMFQPYILNPRVRNELLTAWRQPLAASFGPAFADSARTNPALLAVWIAAKIRIDAEANLYRTPLTPLGVMALRAADPLSRDIFFVALCRALGIPARLEPGLEAPQYLDPQGQVWRNIIWPDQAATAPAAQDALDAAPGSSAPARLILTSSSRIITQPEYWIHFSLGRYEGGEYRTLELEGWLFENGIGEIELPAGDYRLITGTRQNDGRVLARLHRFTLQPGETRHIPLQWRHAAAAPAPLAQLPASFDLTDAASGQRLDLTALSANRGIILAWLDPGREPSQHVLREWQELRPLYEAWGGAMIALVIPDKAGRLSEYKLPAPLRVAEDRGESLLRAIEAQRQGERLANYPVLVYAAPGGAILLLNQGYQVGLGDRVLQTIAAAAR